MKNKVLILIGPTGVGKTETSIKLAKKFNMEIISADSVQVFKEFDIGSAKITQNQMQDIVHYGIDILSPNEEFSVSDFVEYTKDKISEIISKGKVPFIVGGTGLYIKSLVEGYNLGGTSRQSEFRKELELIADSEGLETLFQKLVDLSPELASSIDKNNKVRVIRAIEIATFGGEKLKVKDDNFEYKVLALTRPREELYQSINARCEKMIENGLVEEVKNLYDKYGECQPMRAIGYKEVIPFIKGEISKQEMISLISQHTRNYAKRQLTFIRGLEDVTYFDINEKTFFDKMEEEIRAWLKTE